MSRQQLIEAINRLYEHQVTRPDLGTLSEVQLAQVLQNLQKQELPGFGLESPWQYHTQRPVDPLDPTVGQSISREGIDVGAGREAESAAVQEVLRELGVAAGNPFEDYASQRLGGLVSQFQLAKAITGAEQLPQVNNLPSYLRAGVSEGGLPGNQQVNWDAIINPGENAGLLSAAGYSEDNPGMTFSAMLNASPWAGQGGRFSNYMTNRYQDLRNQFNIGLAEGDVVDTPGADWASFLSPYFRGS